MVVTSWRARVDSKNIRTMALWLVTVGKSKHELAPIVKDVGNGFVVGGRDARGWNVEGESCMALLVEELAKPLVGGCCGLWMAKDRDAE